MAKAQPFRTAIGGFNREDVVNYIAYLNNRHNAQMEQLNTQLQRAQAALAKAQDTAELEQQLEAMHARCAELEQQLETSAQVERELEMYRRAERAERQAKERAALVYTQANAVLADTTAKADAAVSLVTAQLQQLQDAVANSKAQLQDAVDTLYAIHPEEQTVEE